MNPYFIRRWWVLSFLFVIIEYNLEIEQFDVKTTFLHSDLEVYIYMKQSEGFVVKGQKYFDCKLNKFLYGLKQSL